MVSDMKKSRGFRSVLRWSARVLVCLVALLVVAFLVVFRQALYHRFVAFPREARAWQAIRATRIDPPLDDGWEEYRGVCHSHSEVSHDSNVPFEEILAVLKETDRDFICMSDHCVDGKADYSLQWKGLKDGKLFVRGFEMSYGFMPWGLPDETVLDCGEEPAPLAERIAGLGGLLFIAHSEEKRDWDLPEIVGMEIYNIHTDFKDEGFKTLGPDILLNLRAYPDQTFRLLFDRQTAVLANWDRLNATRKMVGIAANDCHQNNGVRGYYTERGTLLLEDTSPQTIGEYKLNPLTRPLVRVLFGPLEPGRELFHIQLDPYERMVRFVSTHVLARELTEEALLDGLEQGRVFIGFDMIADSTGFAYLAETSDRTAVMGEALPFEAGLRLRAGSPCPCRFNVLRDGAVVWQSEGRELDWQPEGPGKYRIEAELDIRGQWVPWVYTNPIELT